MPAGRHRARASHLTGSQPIERENTLFGTKETFVPLEGSERRGDDIVVPFDEDFAKKAPAIDPDGHLEAAQEDELYSYHHGGQAGFADRGVDTDRGLDVDRTADRDVDVDHDVDLADGEVVRKEERLNVGTETQERGRVRLRKHVVHDTETVEVPVQREEVRVERVPMDGTENVRRIEDDGDVVEDVAREEIDVDGDVVDRDVNRGRL